MFGFCGDVLVYVNNFVIISIIMCMMEDFVGMKVDLKFGEGGL